MGQPKSVAGACAAIESGATALGIELGSTRIKACLIALDGTVLADGSYEWENHLADGVWTYALDDAAQGLREAYRQLVTQVEARYGVRPTTFGSLGVSAMMHGYLAFDGAHQLLVPFRTWRNTTTGPAAAELTELFGENIPLRWSVAHLYQAVLDGEPHVGHVAFLTTLAGYVHWQLTGRKVIGVGDASGMFPIDPATGDYDQTMLAALEARLSERGQPLIVHELLPDVLAAGHDAGELTAEGAAWLDPSGSLRPGIAVCPPEGDAGTGMVATNSVGRRTGNVSAGTSIFAMIVLERPLDHVYPEIDLVATPAGDPVAMVHCNNGASELDAWMALFGELATALGSPVTSDALFEAVFRAALEGDCDAGGVLAYNYLAGEPITGLDAGRPMVVRTPDSSLSLANFARAQLFGVFATLALGMRVLDREGVQVDTMFAHGGVFRTKGVAQRLLAAALDAPVAVGATAGEGGAWGIAVLAAYRQAARTHPHVSLASYLTDHIFAGAELTTCAPDPGDVTGFAAYLNRYDAGLAAQRAAVAAMATLSDEMENL